MVRNIQRHRGQITGRKSNEIAAVPSGRVGIYRAPQHLGTVEAPDEKSAIAEAIETFHITPARRFKIVVTKVGGGKGD